MQNGVLFRKFILNDGNKFLVSDIVGCRTISTEIGFACGTILKVDTYQMNECIHLKDVRLGRN